MAAPDDADLVIDLPGLRVQRGELGFRATRAGGPGGQHVNRASTRVELTWDFEQSPSVAAEARELLRSRLARRLDAEGRVRVVAQASRSQLANREAAERRLAQLVEAALTKRPVRKPTRPTAASRKRRRQEKEQRSRRKQERRRPDHD